MAPALLHPQFISSPCEHRGAPLCSHAASSLTPLFHHPHSLLEVEDEESAGFDSAAALCDLCGALCVVSFWVHCVPSVGFSAEERGGVTSFYMSLCSVSVKDLF